MRTVSPSVAESASVLTNSKNCVACTELPLEVAALRGQLIGAHDRERDMVTNPGVLLGREHVGGRRAEELDRRIVERRGVRDVDDNRGAGKNLGQTFACECVDAGRGRRGHCVMTMFGQGVHQL